MGCNSFYSTVQLFYAESSPKNKYFFLSSNPGMASLLNDLDKLDAADNNFNEPDPTNVVAEHMDNKGTLVDIYQSVDEVSRDKMHDNHPKIVADSGFELYLIF